VTRFSVVPRIGTASLVTGLLSFAPLVALGMASGCQDPGKPTDDPPPPLDPTQQMYAGPARDVQLIAQKAVLGFRADGSAFRAGYTTHDVMVQDGIAELTPYHFDASGERTTGGVLAVETGGIVREDGTSLTDSRAVRTNRDGALEIARGAAVEVLTNREDGIEQSWRFDAAPAGTGDLIVNVQITGQEFIGQTATGLHFQSSDGLGFRYSHAVWLDAAGHEWPIKAAWQGDHIAITVSGDLVAESVFPATLDPTISPEAAIDAPVNGWSGQNSQAPAIAFDGTNYLVVWADQRLSRDEDIFGTRISQTGAILDPAGITIAATAGRQLHPTVAFAGTQYVVAWEDFKFAGGTEADIFAARVSTAGTVTPLGPVVASAQNESQPQLAGNAATALLVWNNGGDIRASRFNGTAFGGAINVTADTAVQTDPTVAAAPGGNYLVAYSEGPTATADLRGRFVTAAGATSGAAFTISAGAGRQYDPSASFDGTNYVVAWTNNNAGVNLFGARVSPAGAVLDTHAEGTTPTVGGVSISSVAGNQEQETLRCNAGACLVVWQDSRNNATTGADVFAQRLTTTGALTSNGAEFTVSTVAKGQTLPALATTGSNFFAIWEDGRDVGTITVFGSPISGAGAVASPSGLLLVSGNNRQATPAVGVAGSTIGVFWADSRNFGNDIDLVRFSFSAIKLDATARAVSSAAFSQGSPAATNSAGNFFVVWNDARSGVDRDIFGARVTAAGAVLDAGGIAISTATGDQLVPAVATNGTVSLVVWEDRRNGNFDIFGAIVNNATGAVTVPNIAICTVAGDQGRPAVAFDAASGQFLVVWGDDRIATDANIFGARVTAAGAVLDPDGASISSAAGGQFAPRLSFFGGTALVVWEDRRLDPNGDIFGARVRIGGALTVVDAGGFSISGAAPGLQIEPVVAAVKSSFLVAWTDGRNASTSGTDIFGQQVGPNGVLSGVSFPISVNPENEAAPSLFDTTNETTLVAYTRVRTDLQTVRIQTRTIGSNTTSNGQSCSVDAQCSSGFCVDTKCCDTACGGDDRTDCQACAQVRTGQPDGTCALIPGPNITICRNYANTFCDLREYCTGTSPDCPADIGRNQGLVCNSTTGAVCPSNAAPGPHGCP
jgi:hypothetical protein